MVCLWFIQCCTIGRPYYQSRLWHTVSSVCDIMYCDEKVTS